MVLLHYFLPFLFDENYYLKLGYPTTVENLISYNPNKIISEYKLENNTYQNQYLKLLHKIYYESVNLSIGDMEKIKDIKSAQEYYDFYYVIKFLLKKKEIDNFTKIFIPEEMSNTIFAKLARSHRYFYGIGVEKNYENALNEIVDIAIYSYRNYLLDFLGGYKLDDAILYDENETFNFDTEKYIEYLYSMNPKIKDNPVFFFSLFHNKNNINLFRDFIKRSEKLRLNHDFDVYDILIKHRFYNKATIGDIKIVCNKYKNVSGLANIILIKDAMINNESINNIDVENILTNMAIKERNPVAFQLLIYSYLTPTSINLKFNTTKIEMLMKNCSNLIDKKSYDFLIALMSLKGIKKIKCKTMVKYFRNFINSYLYIDNILFSNAMHYINSSDFLSALINLKLGLMGIQSSMWNSYLLLDNPVTKTNMLKLMYKSKYNKSYYNYILLENDPEVRKALSLKYRTSNSYVAFDVFRRNIKNITLSYECLDYIQMKNRKLHSFVITTKIFTYLYCIYFVIFNPTKFLKIIQFPYIKEISLVVFTFLILSIFIDIKIHRIFH